MDWIKSVCRRRVINSLDIKTPVLIPSFSSKGVRDINRTWEVFNSRVSDVALISCYDIYHENLHLNPKDGPPLLFLDSGGYEARKEFDLAEPYNFSYVPKSWSSDQHYQVLEKIETYSSLVIVSYDDAAKPESLMKQIRSALKLFESFPDYGNCMLVKPCKSKYVTVQEVAEGFAYWREFDVIGFTEKELGNGLASRLDNVLKIRSFLLDHNIDKPIHIFGCLDPTSVWLFYLCGADIFDGLSWLRFGLEKNNLLYRNSWLFEKGLFELRDEELTQIMRLKNLQSLQSQKLDMIRFVRNHDFSNCPISSTSLEKIESLIT